MIVVVDRIHFYPISQIVLLFYGQVSDSMLSLTITTFISELTHLLTQLILLFLDSLFTSSLQIMFVRHRLWLTLLGKPYLACSSLKANLIGRILSFSFRLLV